MAIDTALDSTRYTTARTHVYNVTQLGLDFTLVGSSTKDGLGGTLSERTLDLKGFPIRFAPYDRQTERRISFAEDTDILVWASKKDIDDRNLTVEHLRRTYKKLRYNGKSYDLRYIVPYSAFGTDFLYVLFGGKE